jgi:hypothetical protein
MQTPKTGWGSGYKLGNLVTCSMLKKRVPRNVLLKSNDQQSERRRVFCTQPDDDPPRTMMSKEQCSRVNSKSLLVRYHSLGGEGTCEFDFPTDWKSRNEKSAVAGAEQSV